MKTLEETLDELEKFRLNTHKQIDDNPFIKKKVDFLWRLAGYRLGIRNIKSQAEYMKEQIDLEVEHMKRIAIEYAKQYEEKLSTTKN